MEYSQDDVDGYAQAAWDTYYDEMYKRFGSYRDKGPNLFGNKHRKHFEKIARLCLVNNLSVRDYIIGSLDTVDKGRLYIVPKDFTTPAALERYGKLTKQMPRGNAQERYLSQMKELAKLLQSGYPIYSNVLDILYNSSTPFEAWFRVVYPEVPDRDILSVYAELAWNDLQLDKALYTYLITNRPAQMAALHAAVGVEMKE